MNPTSEEQRITIHIAPGTYREQVSIETPYITLAKEGEGEVVLTWYYGIGYKYYSIDGTGYYNEENAFDKLVNLFLAKIVDEIRNSDKLQFYWGGTTI